MLMRAAVLTAFGAPLEVREVEIADPGPGEVRVRIGASGICGSDVKALDGGSPAVRRLPFVLGHESAGTVESVGEGVTGVAPGDQVIIAMNGPCGRCRECGGGRFHLCGGAARMAAVAGTMRDGTTRVRVDGTGARTMIGIGSFAEYAVVNEPMCVRIGKDAPLDVMCLLACGVVTGVGAVLNVARVVPGSSVLVVGCGGVGLNVVQGAVLAGATTIVAADLVEAKLELAREFGATHTVPATGLAGRVGEIVRGGVDYAFDVTGVTEVLGETFAATRPGGTTVMVGSPPRDRPLGVDPGLLFASRRLMGTQGGDAAPLRDLPMLAEQYALGRLDLDRLVSERVPLEGINEAIRRVRGGAVARSVVVFD
ncbi:Zn-dependent alcohol dehydrogenase [Streptosporangium becharense]|uniref:Zn-dependent alcohol dehydrogenase n=1 Tax=Streptosporangium becharense TaxID=1816182 RepID=A0A7W9IEK9_9ACTN|nr:alcohol dehydrogenase catalytic domain-containing protein [Streptosporangium becharense]MBB2912339.1 Zn-dependent alcohol dehydrogenase [Streptosporangium becharense]MBB5818886.1 Zn-dependent alcohol dehydrogenase [Streptosporangium becharense]